MKVARFLSGKREYVENTGSRNINCIRVQDRGTGFGRSENRAIFP
jgi:hypothetical protein